MLLLRRSAERDVPYTIKPRTSGGFGSLAVLAADPQEALSMAKGMKERGIEQIEIFDDNGDPVELQSIAGDDRA